MPDFLLWHILFLSGAAFFTGYWVLQGRHILFVRDLCQRFGGKVIKNYGATFGWKVVVVEVTLRQRRVFVEYRFRQIQPRLNKMIPLWHLNGELEIRIPLVQKFWLRLLQQHEDETAVNELVTGISQLDKSYVIHANQIEMAQDFLKRSSVLDRIMKLPVPFDRVEIYKGFLKAVITQPYKLRLRREEFENSVMIFLDLIDVYEHQPAAHFHLLPTGSDRSCPFCRGLFDAGAELIVKCVQCGTSLHQQCWQENGQCTTWGCASVIAE
jgi:hypothetical protein